MKHRWIATTAAALLTPIALVACGDDGGSSSGGSTGAAKDPAACAKDNTLSKGKLTVATGNPAFGPWVIDDKPESGNGFEAAVVYAVAAKMGFANDAVTWVRTGFDEVIAPGPKTFDFNIQQFTITAERAKVVSFSDPYYTTNQALVSYGDDKYATATKISDLKGAKLGAAVGTTSLEFIDKVIKPGPDAAVFDDNAAATAALVAKQIDGIVVDLPTSGGIAYGTETLTNGTVVGQFVRQGDEKGDPLGLLFEKDSKLVSCANGALKQLKDDGTLAKLEDQWLKGSTGIPVISRD